MVGNTVRGGLLQLCHQKTRNAWGAKRSLPRKTSTSQCNDLNHTFEIKLIQLLFQWEDLLGASLFSSHFQGEFVLNDNHSGKIRSKLWLRSFFLVCFACCWKCCLIILKLMLTYPDMDGVLRSSCGGWFSRRRIQVSGKIQHSQAKQNADSFKQHIPDITRRPST